MASFCLTTVVVCVILLYVFLKLANLKENNDSGRDTSAYRFKKWYHRNRWTLLYITVSLMLGIPLYFVANWHLIVIKYPDATIDSKNSSLYPQKGYSIYGFVFVLQLMLIGVVVIAMIMSGSSATETTIDAEEPAR